MYLFLFEKFLFHRYLHI